MSSNKTYLLSLLFLIGCAQHEYPQAAATDSTAYSRDAVAGEVRINGQASLEARKANPKARREVLKKAKIRALERYISGQQLMLAQYDECLRPNIDTQIDEYIQGVDIIRDDFDRSLKQLTMVVNATINVARLRNHFRGCRVDRGRIAFVFIACEDMGGDRYRPMRSNNAIEQSLQEFFLNNGYRPIDGMRMEEYNERYSRARLEQQCSTKSGRINFSEAQKAAELLGSDYFAYGTFYVRKTGVDKVTGMQRASTVGQGGLVDLSRPGGELVSSASDVKRPGMDATPEDAMIEARRKAAIALAERMVAQFNAAK